PYEGSYFGIVGSPKGDFVTAFGLRGHIFYSVDRGQSWHRSDIGIKASVAGGALVSDGSICMAAVDGSIMHSMDNGKSFKTLPKKVPGSIALAEINDCILAVVGYRGFTRIDSNRK
ncbi:MAG: WD40/YVTN/BNR-like repeat-containing protein, partial [Promethearchaeota archaeon]